MEKREVFFVIGVLLILILGVIRAENFEDDEFNKGIEFSEIGNIIAKSGERKTLSLEVKNNGKFFLNRCRLIFRGETKNWFYSNLVKGIAPGENTDYIFDLRVPEKIDVGDYYGNLEVSCSETSENQSIVVSVIENLRVINIISVKQTEKGLKAEYSFDNSNFIDNNVLVSGWLVDDRGTEINRVSDSFKSDKKIVKRVFVMEIPEDSKGIHTFYIGINSDEESAVKENVIIGDTQTTGMVIGGMAVKKVIGYTIFIIIITIGIFFIFRDSWNKGIQYKKDLTLGRVRWLRKNLNNLINKNDSVNDIQISLRKD
ncbi:hypothetical protein GF386_01555 [Candidatus Pacearchaeota archaeon]|nr:hypothetical protein [Candidatus Pacearchaeota archaeon]MBD3282866.1 hypothetical protein [Candidatus Pacearchaeota archaeon]